MIDGYDWAGGHEAMLRFGPADGPVVVAALPLFEEANRTRAFVVTILRALAKRGIGSVLPDLPGTGESLVPVANARLADWRTAFASVSGNRHAISLRGGALVVGDIVASHWQLAPLEGADQHRELMRVRATSDGEGFAGNDLHAELLDELAAARIAPARSRVVRLESDPRPADRKLPGTPLWRRAEPGNDLVLAEALADDIAKWVRTCAG